jgi:hypothetical protein
MNTSLHKAKQLGSMAKRLLGLLGKPSFGKRLLARYRSSLRVEHFHGKLDQLIGRRRKMLNRRELSILNDLKKARGHRFTPC